ncbi:unnamed protein product [Diamesa hyperborea]
MVAIKIVLSCVLLFAIVNAGPIDKHTVYITKLTMEQFYETFNHTQNVWMIQLNVTEPSDQFKQSAYILRGVVKAGIIESCSGHNMCIMKKNGKVVFIHRGGLEHEYTHENNVNVTVAKVDRYINETLEFQQKEHLKHYRHENVKIVDFKSEQN